MSAVSPSSNNRPLGLLVTDNIWGAYEAEIRSIAPGVEPVIYVGDDPLSDDQLSNVEVAFLSSDIWPNRIRGISVSVLKAPRLKWMQTFSAGVDNPFFGQLLQRGVRLTTASGATASPIAQTVVLYMLALSRDMRTWMRKQDRREWLQHPVEELDGGRLLVVGMGPIGEEVARLGVALGMEVTGVRRTPRGDEPCHTITLEEMHDALATADWVVLALPLTADTRGMFDAATFARMKRGARFINVGRGELVNEAALVDSLQAGHISGAGLDVFEVEPLPPDSPLWDMENVIVTPHNSGTSSRSLGRVVRIFLDNLRRYVDNQPLRNLVEG